MECSLGILNCCGRLLDLRQPVVMGILNITKDSFYKGSRFPDKNDALLQVGKIVSEGARIVDVGAFSSRPGAPDSFYIDNTVSPGQNYIYQLRAIDDQQNYSQPGTPGLSRTLAVNRDFFTGVYYYPWYDDNQWYQLVRDRCHE